MDQTMQEVMDILPSVVDMDPAVLATLSWFDSWDGRDDCGYRDQRRWEEGMWVDLELLDNRLHYSAFVPGYEGSGQVRWYAYVGIASVAQRIDGGRRRVPIGEGVAVPLTAYDDAIRAICALTQIACAGQ